MRLQARGALATILILAASGLAGCTVSITKNAKGGVDITRSGEWGRDKAPAAAPSPSASPASASA